jgi:hypothetical protein
MVSNVLRREVLQRFHDQQTKLLLFQDFSREPSLCTNFSQCHPLNSAATTFLTFRSHGDPPVPFSAVKMRSLVANDVKEKNGFHWKVTNVDGCSLSFFAFESGLMTF